MRLRLRDFLLDTEDRVLSHKGAALALEPKVFDCIELLASEPGKLVPTARLHDALWPDIHGRVAHCVAPSTRRARRWAIAAACRA